MKICIIGPDARSDTEIYMMETAKKTPKQMFDSVLYASIEKIHIETCHDKKAVPYFKNLNLLDFDIIIPMVNKANADFCYVLLKIFEQHKKIISISSKSLLNGYNEFLLPFILNNGGIETPRTYLAMSRTAIEKNIDTMIYPALLKLPYSKAGTIILDSKSSAKGVVDTLETLNQPITLQETFEDAFSINVLLIGKETYAIKGKDKKYALKKDEMDLVLNVSKLLDVNIYQLNLIKTNNQVMVAGFNIKPKIEYYSEIYNINLFDKCLAYLRKHASVSKENPVFNKFLEWVHDLRRYRYKVESNE
ncbi:MAG: hypothetical protein U9P44_02450 [archaeon]|nr:hypothetical protein [archaeon]